MTVREDVLIVRSSVLSLSSAIRTSSSRIKQTSRKGRGQYYAALYHCIVGLYKLYTFPWYCFQTDLKAASIPKGKTASKRFPHTLTVKGIYSKTDLHKGDWTLKTQCQRASHQIIKIILKENIKERLLSISNLVSEVLLQSTMKFVWLISSKLRFLKPPADKVFVSVIDLGSCQ